MFLRREPTAEEVERQRALAARLAELNGRRDQVGPLPSAEGLRRSAAELDRLSGEALLSNLLGVGE